MLSFVAFFPLLATAQSQTTLKVAELIDELGSLNSESLSVRIERFRFVLAENPTAKGHIIIYRDKESTLGYPVRFGTKLQKYLIESLGVSPERFVVLNGGLNEKRETQLWIVPDGSKLPLTESVEDEVDPSKSFLFDRFHYPSPFDGDGCCAIDGYTEETKQASIDKFVQYLKANPNAKAYLVVYGQYCTDCSSSAVWSRSGKYLGLKPDIYLDSSKTITSILQREKKHLIKHHKIEASRIVTINGGHKKWREIELWLVPENSEKPKPKPAVFPPKRSKTVKKKARSK